MQDQPDQVPDLSETARIIAEAARAAAPGMGFAIVFAVDIGTGGRGIGYCSNIDRADMAPLLREVLARWERS